MPRVVSAKQRGSMSGPHYVRQPADFNNPALAARSGIQRPVVALRAIAMRFSGVGLAGTTAGRDD